MRAQVGEEALGARTDAALIVLPKLQAGAPKAVAKVQEVAPKVTAKASSGVAWARRRTRA